MYEAFLIVLSGTLVGIALGLTGGGGSNFAVPLLVYVIGLAPSHAMPVSLAAVAIVAMVGAIQAIRSNLIIWPPTLFFAAGGMLGAPFGMRLAHSIPPNFLLTGFSTLAIVVGVSMWLRANAHPEDSKVVRASPEGEPQGPICQFSTDKQFRFSAPCSMALLATGLLTGTLSGLFGVGGGFLIVPALMSISLMGIHSAVGTSLVVISLTGLAGSAFALLHQQIPWNVLIPFAAGGVAGIALMRRIALRIAGPQLQKLFAVMIILLACSMLAKLW